MVRLRTRQDYQELVLLQNIYLRDVREPKNSYWIPIGIS